MYFYDAIHPLYCDMLILTRVLTSNKTNFFISFINKCYTFRSLWAIIRDWSTSLNTDVNTFKFVRCHKFYKSVVTMECIYCILIVYTSLLLDCPLLFLKPRYGVAFGKQYVHSQSSTTYPLFHNEKCYMFRPFLKAIIR